MKPQAYAEALADLLQGKQGIHDLLPPPEDVRISPQGDSTVVNIDYVDESGDDTEVATITLAITGTSVRPTCEGYGPVPDEACVVCGEPIEAKDVAHVQQGARHRTCPRQTREAEETVDTLGAAARAAAGLRDTEPFPFPGAVKERYANGDVLLSGADFDRLSKARAEQDTVDEHLAAVLELLDGRLKMLEAVSPEDLPGRGARFRDQYIEERAAVDDRLRNLELAVEALLEAPLAATGAPHAANGDDPA